MKNLNIKVLLATFVLVLVVALGGQHVYHQQRVLRPLESAFLAVDGVTAVEMDQTRQGYGVTLTLAQVSSVKDVVGHVQQVAVDFDIPMLLTIQDSNDDRLSSVYYEMHFAVEEAVALGNFQEMAVNLREIASSQQVGLNVFVDNDYVYVQIHQDDRYLYRVISRDDASKIRSVG